MSAERIATIHQRLEAMVAEEEALLDELGQLGDTTYHVSDEDVARTRKRLAPIIELAKLIPLTWDEQAGVYVSRLAGQLSQGCTPEEARTAAVSAVTLWVETAKDKITDLAGRITRAERIAREHAMRARHRDEAGGNSWALQPMATTADAIADEIAALAAPVPPPGPGATVHELKSWPEYFVALASGEKTFEVRLDDRGYQVGDLLALHEWKPDTETYTGRVLYRRVVYKMPGGRFGLAAESCALGLR